MIYMTEADYNIYDPEEERAHGPHQDSEVYFREGSDEDQISVTTHEREDFETEMGITTDADVLDDDVFFKFVKYLEDNDLLHKEKR